MQDQRSASATPAGGAPVIARPRLHALLDRGRDLPLTVVVACPGSGKRTAVRDWLRERGHTAVWVPADAARSDATRFAAVVAAELERWRPYPGRQLRQELAPGTPLDPPAVALALRTAIAKLGQPLWLVLDAASGPLAPEVAAIASLLLADPPDRLRLLLVAQETPDLPLARLRLARQVAELRADDLRFTPDEAAALLARSGPPPADAVARVLDGNEGWAAGVAAYATALEEEREGRAPAGSWLARGRHLVDDFLREEILAPLGRDARDLLVRTAPLDTFDARVATVALGDRPPAGSAMHLIDRLVAADLCTMADPATRRVRVRSFLRPLLWSLFDEEMPTGEATGLIGRMAADCERRGQVEEAIMLLVAVGDEEGAVGVLQRSTELALAKEDWQQVERWLSRLPETMLATSSPVLVARAWVAHLSGRNAPVTDLAARIAHLDAALPPDDLDRSARAALSEVLLAGWIQPIEADPAGWLARLEAARPRIPASDRFGRGLAEHATALALQGVGRGDEAVARLTEWVAREADPVDAGFARGLQGLAFVHWQAGNTEACQRVSEELVSVATEHGLPVAAAWAHRFLGRVAYERGAFAVAADHHHAAVADPRANRAAAVDSAVGLAACHVALGQPDLALKVIGDAVREAALVRAVLLLSVLRAAEGLLGHRAGRLDLPEALRATEGAAIDQISLHALVHPLAARTELLITEGSPGALAEAERHLGVLRDRAEGCHHLPGLALVETLAAICAHRQGKPDDAVATLGRAADLGAAAGLRRTYLDRAALLRPLIDGLPAGAPLERNLARVVAMVTALPDGGRPRATAPEWGRPSPLELLTVREAEVLGLLAQRMTYKEIAAALSISPETVKHHLTSIYGKLGVDGRRAALLRAADLGWNLAPRVG